MAAIIGAIIVLLGSIFLLIASLGLVRMPDLFNRMQAGTKATTLGSILVYLGFILIEPEWWMKLVLLVIFIFLTNPLSSHALARSALFQKVFMAKKEGNKIIDGGAELVAGLEGSVFGEAKEKEGGDTL